MTPPPEDEDLPVVFEVIFGSGPTSLADFLASIVPSGTIGLYQNLFCAPESSQVLSQGLLYALGATKGFHFSNVSELFGVKPSLVRVGAASGSNL